MLRKHRAFVVGYYGMSNFGDDLFCEIIRLRSSQLLPGYEVKIVGQFGEAGQAGPLRSRIASRAFSSLSIVGSMWRLTVGLAAVARADVIVLGGGSVLSSLRGVWAIQRRLASITGTSFQAIGVSIGPFANSVDRDSVSRFAKKLDRIVVRDHASLVLGRTMGLGEKIELAGDLAALYPQSDEPLSRPVRTGRLIGLSLCNFEGFGPDAVDGMVTALASAVKSTSSGGPDHIVVISLNSNSEYGDDELTRIAVEKLRSLGMGTSIVRYGDENVQSIWSLISSLDRLVAVRLHAAVSAYLCEVPFALLEYHQKCTDFCDDVGQDTALRINKSANREATEASIMRLLSTPTPPTSRATEYKERAHSVYFSR